jgi:hypothetical protein
MVIYLIGCPPPAASKTLVDLIAMRYKPCHVSPMRWPQPTAVTFTLLNINLYIKSTPTPTGLIPIPYHTFTLTPFPGHYSETRHSILSQITSPVAPHLVPQFILLVPHTFILAPINLYLPFLALILRHSSSKLFIFPHLRSFCTLVTPLL